MATIGADCWAPVTGPAPKPRDARVTTGTGPAPTDTVRPIEGDIHLQLVTQGGKKVQHSFVFDKDTGSWYPMDSTQDNQYWGHGYGAPAPTNPKPVKGEAFVFLVGGVGGVGGTPDLKVYDGKNWVDPTDPITSGDEYIDIDTGDIYALAP